jgi:hypothetical protein
MERADMKSDLEALEVVALGKAVKDAAYKLASAGLVAGEYPVDFKVHVSGKIMKGEDYDQPIVAKCDFALLFAVALSKLNGVTVESIVRDSLTANPAMVDGLKAQAAEAIEKIKETTITRCNGKVTAKLEVAVV